ncbi:MAG: hypothetical protein ACRCTE_09625 [Cellulosilyticaceae bacterium]
MSTQMTLKHWLLAIGIGISVGGLAISPLILSYNAFLKRIAPPLVTPSMRQTLHTLITPRPKEWLQRDLADMLHLQSTQVRISFYTGLAIENGGYTETNALGSPLQIGSLAAPLDIPFGTEFFIQDLPVDIPTSRFTVDDRGGAIKRIHSKKIKLDVYVQRLPGESDEDYFRRVNNLGIIHTTALYKLP